MGESGPKSTAPRSGASGRSRAVSKPPIQAAVDPDFLEAVYEASQVGPLPQPPGVSAAKPTPAAIKAPAPPPVAKPVRVPRPPPLTKPPRSTQAFVPSRPLTSAGRKHTTAPARPAADPVPRPAPLRMPLPAVSLGIPTGMDRTPSQQIRLEEAERAAARSKAGAATKVAREESSPLALATQKASTARAGTGLLRPQPLLPEPVPPDPIDRTQPSIRAVVTTVSVVTTAPARPIVSMTHTVPTPVLMPAAPMQAPPPVEAHESPAAAVKSGSTMVAPQVPLDVPAAVDRPRAAPIAWGAVFARPAIRIGAAAAGLLAIGGIAWALAGDGTAQPTTGTTSDNAIAANMVAELAPAKGKPERAPAPKTAPEIEPVPAVEPEPPLALAVEPEPLPAVDWVEEPVAEETILIAIAEVPELDPTEDLAEDAPKRRRRRRSAEPEAEPEPEPEPEPVREAAPPPPKPKPKPPSASDLLGQARAALARGDAKTAYSLAKRSHKMNASNKALDTMAKAACRTGNADGAKNALRELPVLDRASVRRDCRQAGSRIGL